MFHFTVFCLAVVQPTESATAGWRTPDNCGVNCVYALLRTRGTDVDHQSLLAERPQPTGPLSMAELETLLESHGVDAEVWKVPPDELAGLEAPYIAHLDLLEEGGGGHFVFVFKTNVQSFHFIDGTTGLTTGVDFDRFRDMSSGYVLAPVRAAAAERGWFWAVVGSVLVAVGVVAYGWVRLSR